MPGPPRTPAWVFVLTTLVALGTCAIAAAVMVPALLGGLGAWPVLVAGLLIVIAALAWLWVIHRRRDRTLW
jgi:sterol desaturase/sphingolipid hydroxylase (fatty acid hydroxylase superfamily)